MKNTTKTIACLAACLCGFSAASAQDADFDLGSQRSEKQDVLAVPGKKLNHRGIVVNPVPHEMKLDEKGASLPFAGGFLLQGKKTWFEKDVDLLNLYVRGEQSDGTNARPGKKGERMDQRGQRLQKEGSGLGGKLARKAAAKPVRLEVDFGARKAAAKGVKQVSGAYQLRISPRGVSVLGYDERGAFYALQTLHQLMASEAAAGGNLPCLTINDYPDLPNRGVVEGFYGTPWSHEVRLSLIDTYGKYKLNTYLYGPKDDPYHSCPNWRKPYPEKEAQQIKELIDACRRNRVDFVWAIHPGQDIKWNEEDYANLVQKLGWMYDLGVRSFAVFFDDIMGEGTNPEKQVALLNRLTDDFVRTKGDVAPLIVCPTDYSRLWANPSEDGPLAIYGRQLYPEIKVFWTGDVVCSDLTPETMNWLNSRIKRPGYYWWNYPVTDYVRHILMQGPVYGLDTSLTDRDLSGIVSNPMEHGEASKLALYGVADYAWNTAAYNPMDNWERGLVEMMPEAHEAYRTFAIHSCDTENGYRRDESWETKTFRVANWDEALAQALWNEYDKVERTPAMLERGCDNKALLAELRPWLTEFGKLGVRGKRAIDLARIYRDGRDKAVFWNNYVANLMDEDARKMYEAHKLGTMKLQPFYENAMDDMAYGFMQQLTGELPLEFKGMGSFSTARTTQVKLMLDGKDDTYYTSGMSQGPGAWIGVDLGCVRDVKQVEILQGRNSVDDVDYFDHAVLEVSADGKEWQPLMDGLKEQYEIRWEGSAVKARYVRLRRLDSKRQNYAAVRSFTVNPIQPENLGFRVEAADLKPVLSAFDSRLTTAYACRGAFSFEVKPDTQKYYLLFGRLAGDGKKAVKVSLYAASGERLAQLPVTDSFFELPVSEHVAKVQIEGEVDVYEVIAVK